MRDAAEKEDNLVSIVVEKKQAKGKFPAAEVYMTSPGINF